MMYSLEITSLDIAKFFWMEDIGLKKRTYIADDLWINNKKLLEYTKYDDFWIFSNEINKLLMDISFGNIILNEIEEIITIQDELELNYTEYVFYKLNENMIEDFLKQCKLKIMYVSNKTYIYLKMRTLVKSCGYKRRSDKFIADLNKKLLKIELYITDGDKELSNISSYKYRQIRNVKMDEYIRLYSY